MTTSNDQPEWAYPYVGEAVVVIDALHVEILSPATVESLSLSSPWNQRNDNDDDESDYEDGDDNFGDNNVKEKLVEFRRLLDQCFFRQTSRPKSVRMSQKILELLLLVQTPTSNALLSYLERRARKGRANHIAKIILEFDSSLLGGLHHNLDSQNVDENEHADEGTSKDHLQAKIPLVFAKLGAVLAMLPHLDSLNFIIDDADAVLSMMTPLLEGIVATAAIRTNPTQLKKLHVACNYNVTGESQHARHLGLALPIIPSLQDVSLWFSGSTFQEDSDASISTALMTQLPRLERLHLRCTSTTATGSCNLFEPIVRGMALAPRLERVVLSNFDWTEEFSHALRESLGGETQSTVSHLSLTPYNLTNQKWRMTLPLLRTNSTLHDLSISRYPQPRSSHDEYTLSGAILAETVQQLAGDSTSCLKRLQLECKRQSLTVEEYIGAIEQLATNTKLKTLECTFNNDLVLDDGAYHRLLVAAQGNYSLLELVERAGDKDMLELTTAGKVNQADRVYLIEDAWV